VNDFPAVHGSSGSVAAGNRRAAPARGYDESVVSPIAERPLSEKLLPIRFPGPAGLLEGLWKEAALPARGSAVFAHPHPLDGGTMHNKVVYRAAQALHRAGYATLRFNFRGAGASEGAHDHGRGEVDDVRAAIGEAQRRGGLPLLAGGFSFGAAMTLHAIDGDPRVNAYMGIGLPLAALSGRGLPQPRVPALFVTGEKDVFCPPAMLETFTEGGTAQVVVVPGADHFLAGRLEAMQEAITRFVAGLPAGRDARGATAS
jgi:alpha/beta superfamily hydrolase